MLKFLTLFVVLAIPAFSQCPIVVNPISGQQECAPVGSAANATYAPAWTGSVNNSVQRKLGESFSVTDFGANGNCLNPLSPIDSINQIQAAIELAQSADTDNALARVIQLATSPAGGTQGFGAYCISQPVVMDGANQILNGGSGNSSLRPTFAGGPAVIFEPPNVEGPTFGSSLATGAGNSIVFNHDQHYISLSEIPQIVAGMGETGWPNYPLGSSQFSLQLFSNQSSYCVNCSLIGSRGRRFQSDTNVSSSEITTDAISGTSFHFSVNINGAQYTSGNVGTVNLGTVQNEEVDYDGSNVCAYVAGTQVWTQAATGPWYVPTWEDLVIGSEQDYFPNGTTRLTAITGSLDSIQFSNIARHSCSVTTFVPPTAKYASDSNTVVLVNFDLPLTSGAVAPNILGAHVDGGANTAWLIYKNGTFAAHDGGGSMAKDIIIDGSFTPGSPGKVGGIESYSDPTTVIDHVKALVTYWGFSLENNSFYGTVKNSEYYGYNGANYPQCRFAYAVQNSNDVLLQNNTGFFANCDTLVLVNSNGSVKDYRVEGSSMNAGVIADHNANFDFYNLEDIHVSTEGAGSAGNPVDPTATGLLVLSGGAVNIVRGGMLDSFSTTQPPLVIDKGVQDIIHGTEFRVLSTPQPTTIAHFPSACPTYPAIFEGPTKSSAVIYTPIPGISWGDNSACFVTIQAEGSSSIVPSNSVLTQQIIFPVTPDILCGKGGDTSITFPSGGSCPLTDATNNNKFATVPVFAAGYFTTGRKVRLTYQYQIWSRAGATEDVFLGLNWNNGNVPVYSTPTSGSPVYVVPGLVNGATYSQVFIIDAQSASSGSSPVWVTQVVNSFPRYTGITSGTTVAVSNLWSSLLQPVSLNTASGTGFFSEFFYLAHSGVKSVTDNADGNSCTAVTFNAPAAGSNGVTATGTTTSAGVVTITDTGSGYPGAATPTFTCVSNPTGIVTTVGGPQGYAAQLISITVEQLQ